MRGSWIFLSHSSKDIAYVRQIRNEFEKYGHNPLAFHLKCLDSNTYEGRNEIFQLLKREIDARDWFVFCDSDNLRKSKYVDYERAYIMESGKDKIWTLDLSKPMEELKKQILQISSDLSIYVSYDPVDKAYADRIIEALRKKDFMVWTDENIKEKDNDNYTYSIIYGVIVMLISKNSTERNQKDLDYILNCCNGGETIIPVFIGKPAISSADENWYRSGGRCFDINSSPEMADYTPLVELMERIARAHMKFQLK